MITPRIPQFLTDLRNRLRNMKDKRKKARLIRDGHHKVSPEDVQFHIQQDARKNASYEQAVETGYRAKIQRVKDGKGKNTLAGIRFSNSLSEAIPERA